MGRFFPNVNPNAKLPGCGAKTRLSESSLEARLVRSMSVPRRMRNRFTTISTSISVPVEGTGPDRFDYPFYLVLIYLVLDYGRPQSFFPFIDALHPGWFITSVLFFCLISRGALNLSYVQTKCLALLLLIMTIHVPIAVNNYWAFQTLKVMLIYFIVYLSIANFVDSYPKVERFIDSWIIINLVCAIVGIMNGGKLANSAFMGDENDFALGMNIAIPFAFFMWLHTDRFKKKLLYLCAAGVFVAGAVTSLSRGGFIGLVAVGLFCWLNSPKKVLSSVVIALMVAVLYLTAPATYWDEMATIQKQNTQEGTGGERWYSWKCGWRMFLDNPIIGVGQGNFPWNFERYEPPEGYEGRLHGGREAHSIYFTLIPELGVVGTILFCTLLGYSLKGMKIISKAGKTHHVSTGGQSHTKKDTIEELRKLRYVILGVQGALATYFVTGIFLSVLYYPHFWVLMGFSLAIASVGKRCVEEHQHLGSVSRLTCRPPHELTTPRRSCTNHRR
jgi:O-antigen ligase